MIFWFTKTLKVLWALLTGSHLCECDIWSSQCWVFCHPPFSCQLCPQQTPEVSFISKFRLWMNCICFLILESNFFDGQSTSSRSRNCRFFPESSHRSPSADPITTHPLAVWAHLTWPSESRMVLCVSLQEVRSKKAEKCSLKILPLQVQIKSVTDVTDTSKERKGSLTERNDNQGRQKTFQPTWRRKTSWKVCLLPQPSKENRGN